MENWKSNINEFLTSSGFYRVKYFQSLVDNATSQFCSYLQEFKGISVTKNTKYTLSETTDFDFKGLEPDEEVNPRKAKEKADAANNTKTVTTLTHLEIKLNSPYSFICEYGFFHINGSIKFGILYTKCFLGIEKMKEIDETIELIINGSNQNFYEWDIEFMDDDDLELNENYINETIFILMKQYYNHLN